jgi:hypothetical protein
VSLQRHHQMGLYLTSERAQHVLRVGGFGVPVSLFRRFELIVNGAVLPALLLLVPGLGRFGTSASRVDRVPPHRVGPVDAVEFVVETARVTHHLSSHVPPPDGGGLGAAVRARQVHPPRHAGPTFAALHDLQVAPGAVAGEVGDVVLAVVSGRTSATVITIYSRDSSDKILQINP